MQRALISLRRASLRPLRPPFSSLVRRPFDEGARWALLRDVDWELLPGESVLLAGPNGVGKSTLLAALSGRHGVVIDGDVNFNVASSEIKEVSFARDSAVLAKARQAHERGDENWTASKQFGEEAIPSHMHHRRIVDLTPGELRVASLRAAAWPKPPRILLLDEVFNGVDHLSREAIVCDLNRLVGLGTQLVCATHRSEDVVSLSNLLTHITRFEPPGPLIKSALTQRELPEYFSTLLAPDASLKQVNQIQAIEAIIQDSLGSRLYSPGDFVNESGALIDIVAPKTGRHLLVQPGNVTQWPVSDDEILHSLVWQGQPHAGVLRGAFFPDKRQLVGVASRQVQHAHAGFHSMTPLDVVVSGFDGAIGPGQTFSGAQKQIAARWLDALLDDWRQVEFTSLSQGRQMACVVARAAVGLPPVVILNSEGLDKRRSAMLNALAGSLARMGGCGVILVQ